jgi:nitroreductase
MKAMQLDHAIRHRRAIRRFLQQPVAASAIERLIDAAVQAPSAVNKQPWLFTVVCDVRLLDLISLQSKKHLLSLIDAGEAPQDFRAILSEPDFHILYHAPALIVISALKDDVWSKEDAALAAQNLMLTAYAEGLGTCWVGFAQRWLETKDGRNAIDVPEYYRPVAPIIVGHPDGTAAAVPRNLPTIRWIG